MRQVFVEASSSYIVFIGSGLLEQLPQLIGRLPQKAAIVSDSNVWPIYGEKVQKMLESAHVQAVSFVFPAGEAQKCGKTYLSLLSFLAQNNITRSDMLIALGGGVVGDLTGFAAATFLRGIPFVQIPTTLLSMVDSSVGGKTAIDLPEGKNLAGAFYQPRTVICDVDTLSSLPRPVFLDGCAEVIKYAILFDRELFQHLKEKKANFDLEPVIARCVELKAQVVKRDEFDTGERMLLNLGHTVGHGIEKCSQYRISHGKAVAAGTAILTRSARAYGICQPEDADGILALLKDFALPITTDFSAEELLPVMLGDKKRSGDTISLILPQRIGQCVIQATPTNQLQNLMEAGM